MAAFSAWRGGFGGWGASWRAADGVGVLMGAVGQPIIVPKTPKSLLAEAARAAGYIVVMAGIPASRAGASVGADASVRASGL